MGFVNCKIRNIIIFKQYATFLTHMLCGKYDKCTAGVYSEVLSGLPHVLYLQYVAVEFCNFWCNELNRNKLNVKTNTCTCQDYKLDLLLKTCVRIYFLRSDFTVKNTERVFRWSEPKVKYFFFPAVIRWNSVSFFEQVIKHRTRAYLKFDGAATCDA